MFANCKQYDLYKKNFGLVPGIADAERERRRHALTRACALGRHLCDFAFFRFVQRPRNFTNNKLGRRFWE